MSVMVPKYTKRAATIVESFGDSTTFVKYKMHTITQIRNNGPHAAGSGTPVLKNLMSPSGYLATNMSITPWWFGR